MSIHIYRYEHFTSDDWDRVFFLDEKEFTADSKSGRVYCQRPTGERYNPKYMHQRHTYDRNDSPASINAIVCFSGRGLGFIHVYNEELTSTLLIQILKKNLMIVLIQVIK